MTEHRHDSCSDGVIWKCSKTITGRRHLQSLPIRHGSIFCGSNVHIISILFLLYEWAANTSVGQAGHKLQVEDKTVSEVYKLFRNIAAWHVNLLRGQLFGGMDQIVEIDEYQVGRRKHHRGRAPKEIWAFGAMVRGSETTGDIY